MENIAVLVADALITCAEGLRKDANCTIPSNI